MTWSEARPDAVCMRLAALIAFVLGVCALQRQASLPETAIIAWVACAAAGVVGLRILQIRTTVNVGPFGRAATLSLLVAGVCLCCGPASWRMADELAFDDEGRDIAVVGTIASLPVKLERGVRFEFDVERVIVADVRLPSRVLLGWYNGDPGSESAVQPGRAMGIYGPVEAPARHDEPRRFRFRRMDARTEFACIGLCARRPQHDPGRFACIRWYGRRIMRLSVRARICASSCKRNSKANVTVAYCSRWCLVISVQLATLTGHCSTAPALATWSVSPVCTSR